ncbi:ferrichrome-iron receptor [Klebsiella pneumoniae]|uniref:Ferrichrome-iron receptor n=1 Tax=Klebsiella pneumoniae TaxID=573 RepID=A0A378BD08_KLEPN|nr:ferrichrome-iron receptor [Klebsiella pneumoniae]
MTEPVAVRQKAREGYELSATGNLTPDWTIIAGYTQQHATVTEGQNVAQDGSSRPGLHPETCLYAVDAVSGTSDLSVGGGVRYVGSLRRGSDGAVGTPDHTEGYWVADAKLGYRVNSNLDLQLNMYNLFDTDYVASINKSGYRYHPGEPRTFMLTANVHF